MTSVMLRQSAAQYKRDGYYIARQLVPSAQVEDVFSDMHQLVRQQLRCHHLPESKEEETVSCMHQDLQTLFNNNIQTYLATLTLCAKLTSLFELYLHPNIRALASVMGITLPVFQTTPVMHLMSAALRVPNGYQGFSAHQDWPTLQGGLDTITVWIPYVEVDRNLFTMDIIPGSHNKGLFPYTRRDHVFEVESEYYTESDFVPMEVKRGDIVFMSSFSIHRTNSHGDNRLRVSTSWRYENAAEPHFIERSYPCAQKRSVIRELITPDFPSAEQVKNIFSYT